MDLGGITMDVTTMQIVLGAACLIGIWVGGFATGYLFKVWWDTHDITRWLK